MNYSQQRYNNLIDKIEQSFLPQFSDLSTKSSAEEINIANNDSTLFLKANLLSPIPTIIQQNSVNEGIKKHKLENTGIKLPNLDSIKVKLFDVWENKEIEVTQASDNGALEWYFLAQMVAAVECLFVEKLLKDSIKLNQTLNKWERYPDSGTSGILLYGVESLPRRAFGGFYTHFSAIYNKELDMGYYYNAANKIIQSPYNQLIKKPHKKLRKEIQFNKDRIKRYQVLNAASLGLIGELQDIFSECDTDLNKITGYIFKSIKGLSQMLQLLQLDLSELPNVEALIQLEQNVNPPSSIKEVYNYLALVINLLQNHKNVVDSIIDDYGPPGLGSQLLLPSLVSYFVAKNGIKLIWENKESLINYLIEFKDTIIAFSNNWIIQPLISMYHTIRYKNHNLAVISEASLESDIKSLERMVNSFVINNNLISSNELNKLNEQIKVGDLTVVLKEYEKELQYPINNLLFGNLIQTLLIQIQKMKVDANLALNALDSLLKSNEFTFGLIAVIPPVLLTYFVLRFIRNWYLARSGNLTKNIKQQLKSNFNFVFRLLNLQSNSQLKESDRYLNQGTILCQLQYIRQLVGKGQCFKGKKDCEEFLLFLNDLETFSLSSNQRLTTLNHLFVAYPYLLK
ncbi:NCA2-domain-containing protein [Neoconidiobolus thromboides FSU 785]|nr:NCA2-domain-containing protein [Neoconidiobolus thromboides FSU 785]